MTHTMLLCNVLHCHCVSDFHTSWHTETQSITCTAHKIMYYCVITCKFGVCNCINAFSFLWRYSPNLGLGLSPWNSPFNFSFLELKTVSRTPWAGDQLVARPLLVHKHRKTHTYTQTLNIHALSGIRTHDPGFPESEDSACLRSLGYRDRRINAWRNYIHINSNTL
jgi:hypothetical protein